MPIAVVLERRRSAAGSPLAAKGKSAAAETGADSKARWGSLHLSTLVPHCDDLCDAC